MLVVRFWCSEITCFPNARLLAAKSLWLHHRLRYSPGSVSELDQKKDCCTWLTAYSQVICLRSRFGERVSRNCFGETRFSNLPIMSEIGLTFGSVCRGLVPDSYLGRKIAMVTTSSPTRVDLAGVKCRAKICLICTHKMAKGRPRPHCKPSLPNARYKTLRPCRVRRVFVAKLLNHHPLLRADAKRAEDRERDQV